MEKISNIIKDVVDVVKPLAKDIKEKYKADLPTKTNYLVGKQLDLSIEANLNKVLDKAYEIYLKKCEPHQIKLQELEVEYTKAVQTFHAKANKDFVKGEKTPNDFSKGKKTPKSKGGKTPKSNGWGV